MFEKRPRVDLHVTPYYHRQADTFAEPSIANRKCRRLLDRSVPLRQRFDACRMDVAATADDHVLLAAGDTEIARLVDPAPRQLTCGRVMPLFPVRDDSEMLAELLHFRLTYQRHHISKLGEITIPPTSYDLKSLRNHHLIALQIASGHYDFGEEIP
jgi:hypothetical protein